MIKTPILFVIFNRPTTTTKVFEVIRQAKPKLLFIAADGPRENKPNEIGLCNETRKIATRVDWPCEVKTLFREKNLGCGKAVSEAITWFFENVEEGIILEDDCLPDLSFFNFCEDLLERYRFDERVFMISGDNFLPEPLRPRQSYYFSKIAHIWGWATWRRAWNKYDLYMKDFPEFIRNKEIENIWSNKIIQNYWLDKFRDVYDGKINTWDYQWVYAIWKNNGVSIAPNVNLISNIGFGSEGTQTLNKNDQSANLGINKMEFPLINSSDVLYDIGDSYENNQIHLKNYRLKKVLKNIGVFKIIRYLYLLIDKK